MADIGDYTPKVAAITGASQGIGKAIALRLADDGFDIALSDLGIKQDQLNVVAEEIKAKGRKVVVVATDVTKEEDIVTLVEKTASELGGLDVMVANAGIAAQSSFLEMSAEVYDSVMNVNARGTMLCYKHAARQMVKQNRGGRIIGASSVMGQLGTSNVLSAYVASKFAIRGLTQALSFELASRKITVNAYSPGCIITDMTTTPYDATTGDGLPGSFIKHICGLPPTAKDAGPEVVASLVSYICKPEAYFITGQSLSVCGGSRFS
ncbi:hypothetical protein EIP91_002839 [Steccherinum ochraceum]|uniref:NAD(P)-binding protein n=1 Tax=Steccherinum ochraceum TaxID=92696 RepID=A0A4V6N752_9APHY|nr:hypothetical protein EIP91_002839 [Steccherinum ochraceum]